MRKPDIVRRLTNLSRPGAYLQKLPLFCFLMEGRGFTGCGITPPRCHSERSEESRSEYF